MKNEKSKSSTRAKPIIRAELGSGQSQRKIRSLSGFGAWFKNKVYKIVKKIPHGDFLTYKEVARLVGRPKAWRAVGNILNKNKNKKIPCHRVIKSDYGVGGYKNGIRKKVYLLRKEGMLIRNWKIENRKKKKRRVNEKKKD